MIGQSSGKISEESVNGLITTYMELAENPKKRLLNEIWSIKILCNSWGVIFLLRKDLLKSRFFNLMQVVIKPFTDFSETFPDDYPINTSGAHKNMHVWISGQSSYGWCIEPSRAHFRRKMGYPSYKIRLRATKNYWKLTFSNFKHRIRLLAFF